jgi:hypothetical protein
MKKSYPSIFLAMTFTLLVFFQISSEKVIAQCAPVDHGGADLIISAHDTLGGEHTNIGKFQVANGVTLFVNHVCKYLIIHADTIIVNGVINGNFAGEAGGGGGGGGVWANGSGNPGQGGQAGIAGYGPGGGIQGAAGGAGGFITQICGGLFCSGNRDGLNGGGGGGGAGSGAAYGGAGGIGGWGAFGSGFTGASGGDYGVAGVATNSYGSEDGIDITWGSGGGGAGGGGGSWNYGTAGGAGGKGGGMVRLNASGPLILTGSILCDGAEGGVGGNGGGESTSGTFTCSSSGYSACGICSESIFDASGGAGGGGGGGAGGGIMLQANGPMTVTGTLSAKGGHGGTAGHPRSTTGTCFDDSRGGGSGGGGRIKIFSNPCFNHNLSPTATVIPGSGGAGNVVGIQGNPGSYRNDLVNPDYTPLAAGSIALIDPEFCFYGDVPLISSPTSATGGMPGLISYQWQYSIAGPTSGFGNIPGQTNATYDPAMISQTTWYRRRAISGICEEFSNVVVATVLDCTTIDESESPAIKIYPNPATNEVFVQLPQNTNQLSSVQIINLLGQTVYSQSVELVPEDKVLQLNIQLPSGNYIVRIIADDNTLNAILTVQ